MEQNNFEKNVKEKLDELKVQPSDTVWVNVEKRIAKRRDKRIVLILFFVFLFILSGGYWLFNSTNNNTQKENHSLSNLLEKNSRSAFPANRQTNNQDSSSGHSIVSSGAVPETTNTLQNTAGKIKTPPTASQNEATKRAAHKKQENISATRGFIEEREAEVAETKTENSVPGQDTINQSKIKPGSLSDTIQEKLAIKKDSSAKKIFQDLQKHKWIFGVTLSGGMSFLSNGILNINNNSGDYLSAPNSGIGNSGTGNVAGGAPSGLPAKTINSTAFIGGVFVERNISQKSQISLGINYKYFSTVNKTGNKIDSVLTSYNSSTYTNTYRNHFNYLELPVSFKFQLTNDNSLPVYWLAGINISQLIRTNALQFKNSPGVYYNDNSLFNKTQLGFSTGFVATLFSQKKVPVNIGPYFYYSASRMANEGLYNKKHFNFIGIKAEILLRKK